MPEAFGQAESNGIETGIEEDEIEHGDAVPLLAKITDKFPL